jgi:hypothetical protein
MMDASVEGGTGTRPHRPGHRDGSAWEFASSGASCLLRELAPRRHPVVWALVVAGLVLRVVLAFSFFGHGDIEQWLKAQQYLRDAGLDFYSINPPGSFGSCCGGGVWPYPPLGLFWMLFASVVAGRLDLPFHGVVQLLPILADIGIGIAVYVWLGWRGAPERWRLAGLAVVMFGPPFVGNSGYHGQIDAMAIFPAVVALMLWERFPANRRAVVSGLLIGLGAAVKTVPLLLLLVLLPSARSLREAATLVGLAAAVPAALLLPFLIAEPAPVLQLTEWGGFPGFGGLSLIVEPGFPADYFSGNLGAIGLKYDAPLQPWATPMLLVGLAGLAALVFRYRPSTVDAAVMLWLTIYVFSPNFFYTYVVWALPFFLIAGYIVETAALSLLFLPAMLTFYVTSWPSGTRGSIYTATMIVIWFVWVAALAICAIRVIRRGRPAGGGSQPPLVDLSVRAPAARQRSVSAA